MSRSRLALWAACLQRAAKPSPDGAGISGPSRWLLEEMKVKGGSRDRGDRSAMKPLPLLVAMALGKRTPFLFV